MDYSKHYDLLIERAKTRIPPEGYIERHHVIPRCMGGSDEDSNLAVLTPEEHYLAHLLLVKMYPDNSSLVYAANKMTVKTKRHFRNNKRYGWLKRKFSEVCKEDSKGSGNTQYGTMWINKIGTTENKKIQKGDTIPDGWQAGRNIKTPKKISCIICGNVYTKKGKETTCSIKCRKILKGPKWDTQQKRIEFINEFKKTNSMNTSLINIGLPGAHSHYHAWAKMLLEEMPSW